MPSPDRRLCRDYDPVFDAVKARRVRGDRKGYGLDRVSAPDRSAAIDDGARVSRRGRI
jgi:hypothetical protein